MSPIFSRPGQRVVALLEPELQEVRRRHELRLAHLLEHVVGVGDRPAGVVVVRRAHVDAGRPDRDAAFGAPDGSPFARRSARRFSFSSRFVWRRSHCSSALRRSFVFRQLDAVGADRAAHEDALADEPGVFAAHAPEREAARAGEVELSFSSRTYCWSFFQLSSRRASTFSMKASRSDCADEQAGTAAARKPRQSRASKGLVSMAESDERPANSSP